MASRSFSAEAEAAYREEQRREEERLTEALNDGSMNMTFWEFLGLLAVCAFVIWALFGGLHIAHPL